MIITGIINKSLQKFVWFGVLFLSVDKTHPPPHEITVLANGLQLGGPDRGTILAHHDTESS